jgi:hypothetical protein
VHFIAGEAERGSIAATPITKPSMRRAARHHPHQRCTNACNAE